ncbi:hypothetical protein V3589_19770 [Sinorhizobium fredii]|uniref:hypothetical protein n=1 Tax=Rhizobium fredii TaxID=380 RepID=UPI0030A18A51
MRADELAVGDQQGDRLLAEQIAEAANEGNARLGVGRATPSIMRHRSGTRARLPAIASTRMLTSVLPLGAVEAQGEGRPQAQKGSCAPGHHRRAAHSCRRR